MATFSEIPHQPHFSGESEVGDEVRSFVEVMTSKGLSQSQAHDLSYKVQEVLDKGFSYGKLLREFNSLPSVQPEGQSRYQQAESMLDGMLNFKSSDKLPYDNSEAGD